MLKVESSYNIPKTHLGIDPKDFILSVRDSHPCILLPSYKSWEIETKCASTAESAMKMWCIHIVEIYSELKKNGTDKSFTE